jgi:hypothetical protein
MTPQVVCYVPYSQETTGNIQLRLSVVNEKYFSVAILYKPGFVYSVIGGEGKEQVTLGQVSQTLAELAPHKFSHSGEQGMFAEYTYPSYTMDKVLPFLAERSAHLPCVDEVLAFNPPMTYCGVRLRAMLLPYTKHSLQEMMQQVAFPQVTVTPVAKPVLKRHNAPMPVCQPAPTYQSKPASSSAYDAKPMSASIPVNVSSLVGNVMGAVMPHLMGGSQKTTKSGSQTRLSSLAEVMKQMAASSVPVAPTETPSFSKSQAKTESSSEAEEKVDAAALNELMGSLLGLSANSNMAVGPSSEESMLGEGSSEERAAPVSRDGEQE